ncbi:hypothetical protein HDU80_010879 [Chytriomyces hyalinus]|nr:hypothetical protein HDU80_010879 [Chytriomyces hyalinus]
MSRIPTGAFTSAKEARAALPKKVAELLQDSSVVITGRIGYLDWVLGSHLNEQDYRNFIDGKLVGIVLKSVSLKYRRPVVYPDTVTIGIKLGPVNSDRFDHVCCIVSHKYEAVVAEGVATLVFFDHVTGAKAKAAPHNVVEAMLAFERKYEAERVVKAKL